METYTRDSDGKKFKARCTMRLQENTYYLEPIDENPMPDVVDGDFLECFYQGNIWSIYIKADSNQPSKHTINCCQKIYRNGKLIWEAKK